MKTKTLDDLHKEGYTKQKESKLYLILIKRIRRKDGSYYTYRIYWCRTHNKAIMRVREGIGELKIMRRI